MFKKIAARSVLFFVLVFSIAMVGMAQDATTGSISGTIADSSGALIKGATVSIVNTDRGDVERTLTTNGSGFYTATALPLGHYVVKVSDKGFKTETVTGITLHVSDALTVSTKLIAGGEGETVTVTADAVSLNLQDATQAGLINSKQLEELVMPTSNYASLITLQPGVTFSGATDLINLGPTGASGSSSTVAYSVNGARTTSNNWTIDGADNLDRGANLTLYVYISPRAVSEFKTMRGQYSAEYGRNASGQVDVVTKSGTNQIHGGAYEFFRNDYLDAPGYLNDYLGTRIAKYRYNNFGFYLGGPVIIPKVYNGKGKTFWFVSENWFREILYSSTTQALVPTAEERAGNFTNEWYLAKVGTQNVWQQGPVNVCTAYTNNPATQTNTCTAVGTTVTGFSNTAQQYMKDLYKGIPVPNEQADVALGLDPHTIINNIPNRFNNLDTTVRIDHQIGQRLNLLYRYVHDTFPTFQGSGTFVAVPIPGVSPTITNSPGTQQLGKGTWTINSTMVANLGYAYSSGGIYTRPQGALLDTSSPDVFNTTQPKLPFDSTPAGVIPTLAYNSYFSTLGAAAAYVDHGINHQVFGDVTKLLGNHTLIVGFSYDHYEKQENNNAAGNQGVFNFTNSTATAGTGPVNAVTLASNTGVNQAESFANFLTGNVNNGFTQANRISGADVTENIYEGFVQDNWKARPRLTLNIGVRYTYMANPTDATGYMNNFDPSTYSASKAPVIASNGLICWTATCSQAGSTANPGGTAYNPGADFNGLNYLNGLVFANPNSANNNQASSFGNSTTSMQKTGFAPRLGFALDVFGDGKTALRGGYGWSFDELETSYWETTDWGNPPAVVTYSATQASMDSPSGGSTPTSCTLGSSSATCTTPGRAQATPLHAALPYTQQYSLDVQQSISPSFFIDIAYAGSHGTHLAGVEEINQPVPNSWRGVLSPVNALNTCTNTATAAGTIPMFFNSTCDRVLNQIKPYLGWFAIDAMRTIFSSNYNSLQVKTTKQFSGKSYIDANFTWSRTLTNSPADYSGFPQDIYNVNGDYGPATFSRKLVLTVDGVYELPWYREQKGLVGHMLGGWELSSIYTAVSGLPLTISASGATTITQQSGFTAATVANNPLGWINDNTGLSLFGNTNAGIRANQIADPNSGNGVRLHPNKKYENVGNSWFNTSAFAATDPTSTIAATAKRGDIIGPGFGKFDLGIFRNFRIFDNLVFQFRGEAFNAFNHTNIQTVSTSSSSSLFGQVTGYRDPRVLQIAGRLTF